MDLIETEVSYGKLRGRRADGVNLFQGYPMRVGLQASTDFAYWPRFSPGQTSVMRCNWACLLSSHSGNTNPSQRKIA